MKNIFRLSALLLCLCFTFQNKVVAQDYKSAVGIRLGSPWAASYKTFISESSALEGYVGFRSWFGYSNISLNGAYQVHKDIESVDGLQWYFGGGGGVELYRYRNFDEGNTVFKISGYLGLQYTFADTPISATVDWVPSFVFGDSLFGINTTGFRAGYYNLGVRYVLGRQKTQR